MMDSSKYRVGYFPVDKKYNVGEMVVVTTSKGTECATVSKANHEVPESLRAEVEAILAEDNE